jgi:hypothetical protein
MSVRFEWDPKKAASNLSKYSVAFEEALTVFANPLAKIFDDEQHARGRAMKRARLVPSPSPLPRGRNARERPPFQAAPPRLRGYSGAVISSDCG